MDTAINVNTTTSSLYMRVHM